MALDPCPSSPNCVSSLADADDRTHHIDALAINHSASEVLDAVEAAVIAEGGEVAERAASTLDAIFVSRIFRFKDDVSFLVDDADRRLHARSASRVGHSDLGANRKRVNALYGRIDAELNSLAT